MGTNGTRAVTSRGASTSWPGGRPPPPPRRRFEPENRGQEVMNVKKHVSAWPAHQAGVDMPSPAPRSSEHRTYDARRPGANAATPARSRTRTCWRRESIRGCPCEGHGDTLRVSVGTTRNRRTTRCAVCRGNCRMETNRIVLRGVRLPEYWAGCCVWAPAIGLAGPPSPFAFRSASPSFHIDPPTLASL